VRAIDTVSVVTDGIEPVINKVCIPVGIESSHEYVLVIESKVTLVGRAEDVYTIEVLEDYGKASKAAIVNDFDPI
jgi:hypothetical protein